MFKDKSSKVRDELIRLGYQNAKRFSWNEMRRKTLDLYKNIGNEYEKF